MTEKLKSEVEVILETAVPYTFNGNRLETKRVVLKAISVKQKKISMKFNQCILRTFRELTQQARANDQDSKSENKQTKKEEKDEEKESPQQIISMLLSSDTDFDEVIEPKFLKLFYDGCALMDDKAPMTPLTYEKMTEEDLYKLYGEYLVNFTLPKLMPSVKKA